jgi:asparaginyl-tRNA synthetase
VVEIFVKKNAKTRRHLTEFWMVEPEVAYFDLDDDMLLMEDMVVYLVEQVLKKHEADLVELERNVEPLKKVKKPFPRLSYNEAVEILKSRGINFTWGNDFGGEDETVLSEQFDRPFMVHRFPSAFKAFYMKRDPNDPKLSLSVDMLAPEGRGEIIGGGQREEDLAVLEERIVEHQLPKQAFEWYFDLRRYGSVPHAGFGLGVERFLAWVCGLHHVRETIAFPRLLDRLSP